MMCRHSTGCWTSERGSKNYCRYYRPCGRTVQCWEKSKAYTFFINSRCDFSSTARETGGLNKSCYMGFGVQSSESTNTWQSFFFSFFFQFIYGIRISALDLGGRAVLDFCH